MHREPTTGIIDVMTVSNETSQHPSRNALALLAILAICFGASAIGGLLTAASVDSWYLVIAKPSWTPPSWLFGPVWTLLFAAMAVAAWRVWGSGGDTKRALTMFGVQLALNVAWSGAFFGLQSPAAGLVVIVLLLTAIVTTAIMFRRHSQLAAALMVPYALWVSFATALNTAILLLN